MIKVQEAEKQIIVDYAVLEKRPSLNFRGKASDNVPLPQMPNYGRADRQSRY